MKNMLIGKPSSVPVLIHYSDGKNIEGPHADLHGDCSALRGDCSDLTGDCSYLRGDCSGLTGNCSGLSGNLDSCELSQENRVHRVNIRYLVEE